MGSPNICCCFFVEKIQASNKCIIEDYFSYFSTETYVVGTQKNHLIECINAVK